MKMTQTNFPEFKGKPLVKPLEEIPKANFLEGDFGKAVFDEYDSRVKRDYENNSALNALSYQDGIVKGSNPFAVVLVNQILREEGLRTATPLDLERVLKVIDLNLSGCYEDSALVLRSIEEPNKYLAGSLAEQVRAREKRDKAEYPIMIPLAGLELKTDSNSLYNLAFNLREDAEIIHALILNQNTSPVSFSSGDIDENTGLPKQTREGTRYLYTGNSGLVRLFLGRDLGLGSYFGGVDLGVSNSDGRIVVIRENREVMQNFDSHVKQLQIERDKQVAEIDSRYQQALQILRGLGNNF